MVKFTMHLPNTLSTSHRFLVDLTPEWVSQTPHGFFKPYKSPTTSRHPFLRSYDLIISPLTFAVLQYSATCGSLLPPLSSRSMLPPCSFIRYLGRRGGGLLGFGHISPDQSTKTVRFGAPVQSHVGDDL